MVFLDNVLSGSQNKECRQIFVEEQQELDQKIAAIRSMVDKEDCKVMPIANSAVNWKQYKTARKWQSEG